MIYLKPEYFDRFQCTADKCPDTCCAGWQIMIDEDSLERYDREISRKRSSTDEADFVSGRLLNGIDWEEGSFLQFHKRCSMLNEQNLCDLVIYKGEEWLCETCTRYPRHVEEFEGLREWSLSLSCPVAADIILNWQGKVKFLETEDEKEDPLAEEFEDFDFLLFTQLEDARAVLFSIVQNKRIPMNCRMALVLEMARQVQLCVDEERLFDMEQVISQFAALETDLATEAEIKGLQQKYKLPKGENRFEALKESFGVLEQLERLREDWSEVLKQTKATLYSADYADYEEIYEAFCKEYLGEDKQRIQWENYQQQLLIFFLYTYFCGAVYDDCIFSKAALAVFSVAFLQEFVMCSWFLADKYIDKQECVRLAYRYAREVEHSDENLNLLEEWLLEQMQP